MAKNKGGREVRKPKQAKKPKESTEIRPTSLKIDGPAKKAK
jgi:hypothetical protein